MNKTIVVRRNYLHYVKKYARCDGSSAAGASACAGLGGRGDGPRQY